MVELIPYMLIILGWHPDRPGDIDLQRPGIVFASEGDCSGVGDDLAAKMTLAAADKSGARYTHRCLAVPGADEFDAMLAEHMTDRPGN